MPDFLQRESNTITIANFFEAYQLRKYNFEPEYQRRSIWSDEKKSFLINSIVKNFPIPPIFLHQKIDDKTGITRYDVIDGKQRLFAIIDFLENKISISDEEEQSDVAGLYFSDLDRPKYSDYKKRIWRYALSIEYIDTGEQEVIDSIFDRLNRNGEPLTGQELRNANYYATKFLQNVEKSANHTFWKSRLTVVDKARMEDIEFISELYFLIGEGKALTATQSITDEMYEKYTNKNDTEIEVLNQKFEEITSFLNSLNLNYEKYGARGVSHLYGLFGFGFYSVGKEVNGTLLSQKLTNFYEELRERNFHDEHIRNYKTSMSASTKSASTRKKRIDSLIAYCGI